MLESEELALLRPGVRQIGLADLYRKVWATGQAGVTVELGLLRESDVLTIAVETGDRSARMKLPRSH